MDKNKLNKEQLQAIKHKSEPLLIIAGAGTGKTTVITERIKYLVLGGFAKPSEILALTFTEKAAREMETRVDVALPYGYTQMWIMTFHSFCDRILRDNALHIGLDPRYKLMTEAEAVQLIRFNLFHFDLDYFRPLGNPTKFVGGMLQHISRLQDEDIAPVEYVEWVRTQKSKFKNQKYNSKIKTDKGLEIKKWKELAGAYKTYDELKVKEGVMDFGDLIVKTLKLFRKRPNVLGEYQKKFKYILIDEFQDTNYAQNELALLLSRKHKNITVVGDDDQSVYRFRGAAVSNIIQFRKNFPRAKVIVLTKNYRSTQAILDRAYNLIQNNNPDRLEVVEKVNKKLVSTIKKDGEEIKFIHSDRVENEAEQVAKEIERLVADGLRTTAEDGRQKAVSYGGIAILVRANNHADPFVRAFQRLGIPYQFLGPGRLFKQPEIIDLISYLKVLYDFDDSISFYRVLSIEFFAISARDLIKITNYARRLNKTIFEACDPLTLSILASQGQISPKTYEKIKDVVGIINKQFKLIRSETAGQLLYNFLTETGYLQKVVNPDSAGAQKRAGNISKFFDKLRTYEVGHEDASVQATVDWIELSQELGESPLSADTDWTEVNAVNILTLHSAKGLEFPAVFLVNLVSQRFPTVERREQIPIPDDLIKEILPKGDYHLEEERRLFYVGMTRAKDKLFLTAADYYGEGKREKKLSPFIFEALGKNVESSTQQVASGEQLSFLDYKSQKFTLPATSSILQPHIDFLSYSQIETFKICPLHYKLRYIYKIPTPPSASQSFGNAIHATLKDFFQEAAKLTYSRRFRIVGLEKVMFELLKKNWISEGFRSKSHEQKFFEKGKVYLSGFLKEGFDPKIIPTGLEEPFTIPLHHDPGSVPLKIGGKIDRVDVLSGGLVEIIDYKTGAAVPSQREVDRNLQLSFYGLAASTMRETPFGGEPKDVKLSLYFLDTQEKISTTRTDAQLASAIKEIYKARKMIEESDFKCSGHIFCENCEYKLFCKSDGD